MNIFISDSSIVLILFTCTIVALIRFQNHPEQVFGVLLLVLVASGIVTGAQVIKSFANQGVLTLMLLMVCSLALEKTRLLRVAATFIVRPNYVISWLRLFGFSVLSSAFLNNTAVVSTLLAPIRNNPYHAGSRLLLPLSYAAIFGGTLTLIGTSTNLIVNSMAINAHLPALGFFDFTPIGIMVVLVCGIVLLLCSHWLPHHNKGQVVAADYFVDAKVQPGSALIGKTIEANGLRNLESLFLVEILRDGRLISPVTPFEIIKENDRLIFSGDIKKVTLLTQFDGLNCFAYQNGLPLTNLKEVIIRPDSVLTGKKLKLSGFRALFDSAVVGIRRDGEKLSGKLGDIVLKAGDYLIIAVGDDFKSRRNIDKNFYRVSDVEAEQCLSGWQESLAVYGFVAVILFSALGYVPLFTALLVFLGGLLLSGCLSSNEIMHRLPKNIWLIISSALLLSEALTNTGALNGLKNAVADNSSGFSPLLGIAIIYLMTWILTEFVTNNAAAALIFPISMGLAESLHANPQPYLLALAFGASASFMSPYGYQTNLMVYSAGNYRLKDFIKVGLPISVIYGTVVVGMLGCFYL